MVGPSALISLYPLRQEALRTAMDNALAIFPQHRLERQVCRCGK